MPTVLVVDDDRSVLHTFERSFADTGTRLCTARSAAEGVRQLTECPPDVVILDIMLPDQSGLETYHQIHAHDPKLPVIFITAGGTSGTAIESDEAGGLRLFGETARREPGARPGEPRH